LFAQEKIEQFPADLSEFIGAILRRLDATNLSADLGATLEDAAERLDLDIVEQYDPERVRLVEIRSWRDDDDPNREPLYDTFEEWAVQQEAVFEEDVDLTPDNLVFPDGVNPMERAAVALRSGKHVIFTGPPGTGKTEVAGELAERFVNTHELVTATADWSTFDTIGGYRPERDQTLQFHPGVFLDRFRSDSQGTPANEWLIIDELNRADIDKAFGSLFSALTGESVTLPFEASNGDAITLVGDPDHAAETTISPARYYMSDDWRLLATMNTADKTSLYQMSFAFMRRFAFVPVPIPDDITPDLVQEYASCWVDDQILESTNNAESGTDLLSEDDAVTIANVWQAINGVQPIGPAIIEDVLSHLQSQGTFDLTDPIIMYVMPQLEGCSKAEKQSFLSQLAQLDEEADQSILTPGELVTFAADYFDIDPDSVNWQTTDG
jgi:DNA polymerase III delta prime subunit